MLLTKRFDSLGLPRREDAMASTQAGRGFSHEQWAADAPGIYIRGDIFYNKSKLL
jgi:hypothetical protein